MIPGLTSVLAPTASRSLGGKTGLLPTASVAGPMVGDVYVQSSSSAGPAANAAGPVTGTGTATSGSNPWPDLATAGVLAGVGAAPGPIGAALNSMTRAGLLDALRRVEQAGGTFERQRGFRLPFLMKKYVPLTAEQLHAQIETQPRAFTKRYNVNLGPLKHERVSSLEDLQALDALYGLPEAAAGPKAGALAALRSLEGAGWTFGRSYYHNDDTEGANAYSAFRYLGQDSYGLSVDSPQGAAYRLRTLDSVVSLDFFKGSGADHGLAQPEVAKDLKSLVQHGFELVEDGERTALEPWVVYQGLEDRSGRAVQVRRPGELAIAVAPQSLGDIPQIGKGLDEANRLYRKLAPTLAETGQEGNARRFLDELSKEHAFVSREIRTAALADLLRAGEGGEERERAQRAISDLQALLKHSQDEVSFALQTNRYVSLLREQGRSTARRMWDTMDQGLRNLASSDAEHQHLQQLFSRLLDGTRSISAAAEGVDLVRIPAGNETKEERVRLFEEIAASESDRTLYNTARDYRAVLVHRQPDESLVQAGARMSCLLRSLAYGRQQEHAARVFAAIQIAARDGRLEHVSADDLLARFTQALALHADAEKALDTLRGGTLGSNLPGAQTVERDDENVIIGGIKIPRSKS